MTPDFWIPLPLAHIPGPKNSENKSEFRVPDYYCKHTLRQIPKGPSDLTKHISQW